MSRLLLVDNSNTRTKFALAENGELLPELRYLPTADISPRTLRRTLDGWAYSRAIICSVAPQAADTLSAALESPVSFISSGCCPRLLRHYPKPETLGADRIANAAAAAAYYPLPAIAIDLGTACTFDLVTEEEGEATFAGGVISPGLQTIADGLAAKAALLPALTPAELAEPPAPLGRSTHQALHAGLYYGYRGMLAHIVSTLATELTTKPCLVLTGGDAALFPEFPGYTTYTDNLLTIKGISKIAQQIYKFF